METVLMRSPRGEVKEISARAEELIPLMVAGWLQVEAPAPPPAPEAPEIDPEE